MRNMRAILTVAAIALALTALLWWTAAELSASRRRMEASAKSHADCIDLVSRIEALRRRPAVAGIASVEHINITRRLQAAAEAAKCPTSSIARIDFEPARRLPDTPYLERSVQILLKEVTLRQAVTLLHALTSDVAGMNVKAVRLTAPREEQARPIWNVEATLATWIYAPQATDTSTSSSTDP